MTTKEQKQKAAKEYTANVEMGEAKPEAPNQPTPTQQKMWAWIQTAWLTCPTDMSLDEWYQKYREPLMEMYTAQAELPF